MDVKWLDDFLAVVDSGSFAAASAQRHASPSAMTRRIQSLEEWVGTPLVDRRSSPLRPTEAGEKFRPLALILRNTLEAARAVCAHTDKRAHRPLALAMPCSVAEGPFPGLLGRWHAALGPMVPSLTLTTPELALKAVIDERVDLALVHQYEDLPLVFDDSEVEGAIVAPDEFALYLAPGAAHLVCRGEIDEGSASLSLLSHGVPGYFGRLEGLLLQRKPPCLQIEVNGCADTPAALKALVKRGLGAAFLPASTVRDELARGELERLPFDLSLKMSLVLVRRRRPRRSTTSVRPCDAVFQYHLAAASPIDVPTLQFPQQLPDDSFAVPEHAWLPSVALQAQPAAIAPGGSGSAWLAAPKYRRAREVEGR